MPSDPAPTDPAVDPAPAQGPSVQAPEASPVIERDQALETPQAIAEREQSEYAYTDLPPAQTEELLRESFDLELGQIDADPSRALAEVTIESSVSPTEAIVETEGEKALLESTVPIRVPAEDGKLAKVDLGLERTEQGGFAPKNSLADVSLPADSSGAIEVGDIALTLAASGERNAARSEASAARTFGEEDLVLPEVAEDTSLLLSPITGGVELSALVASRRSPEQLSFAVAMPAGARLLAATDGGAEVVRAEEKGEPLARIGAPFAVDAQGTVVPVALVVKENTIVLDFPHRSMDIAYPLFIDPEIEEHWEGFADPSKLNHWNWQTNIGVEDYIGWRSCIVTCWGNGLYLRARSNFGYLAGSYGRWWFVPQGSTTYLRRVIFGPMNFDPHINPSNPQNCWNGEPHGYAGVWNNGNFWSVHAPARPTSVTTWVDTGEQNLGPGARTAFVGMHADAAINLKCGRDYAMNGAVLYLSDPEIPAVSVSGYPTKWVKDNSPFTLNVSVYDPGLGVKSATVSPKDFAPWPAKVLGCTGHYNSQCPATHTFQWATSADGFDQGEREVQVSAKDAMEKTSSTFAFMLKVDRTPPDLTLANQLAIATKEAAGETNDPTEFDPLSLPVYNLTIKAEDGVENGTATQRRSGVKSIEVFLDGEKTPRETWTQPACTNSCDMEKTFTLKLNELTALTHHKLRVVVKDHAGNTPREREIEFEYVPATGMKEEYVLHHFPLPNGQGDEDSEENPVRPELAVNVMNGNLVYRQRDAEVSGPGADLEVERFYNSLLPDSQDTEWGDGWTLAQTPTLETEAPDEATLVEESGAVESQVELPDQVGEERFDDQLQAVISKEANGYQVTDESGEGEGTVIFNEAGEAIELEASEHAGVDYDYDEGTLAEIAVEDLGTAAVDPEELEPVADGPTPRLTSEADLGTPGTEPGQLDSPSDVATDPQGDVWVLDQANNRVQEFSSSGQLLTQFGGYGSGDGQLDYPSSLVIDQAGNIWITDRGNHRVQKFSPSGQFLAKFGAFGFANGKLMAPNGIAIAPDGSIWVSDTTKVQRFTASGEFIERVAPSGSAPGQINLPQGLATDLEGNVYVAEGNNKRISVFDEDGDFLRLFGTAGSEPGQLEYPSEVEVDEAGNVWVADYPADEVELFDSAGDHITSFGSAGTGEGQFDLNESAGISSDGQGRVWVSDPGNDRVQMWLAGHYRPSTEETLKEDDPQVEIEASEGLVESIEGDEVGTLSYEHSGELLTEVSGPEGETTYEYDGTGRMTKVTLPNGTYAEIDYEANYGRVKSVTVSIEGASPKTTYFNYEDQPQRKTTVTPPPPDPVTTYEFAADGSMIKGWNTKEPPTIDDVAGTLHDVENRETASPIAPGLYNLWVQASSPEGIASIQIVANGSTVVSEKTCPQVPGPPVECPKETDEWVTETANWAPGIVYIEVIVTDSRGESASERFWVNIPYTPPPDPEAEEEPRFADILKFREDFGLDLDLKGDEEAMNDRIFNLIGAWRNPYTPAGEVARASMERWGVPLRPVDVAEMEYRESYMAVNIPLIETWATQNRSSTYAGYYVDHPAGGILRVGFTQDQAGALAQLKQQSGMVAVDRLVAYSTTPTSARISLQTTHDQVEAAWESDSVLASLVTGTGVDERSNVVEVTGTDPAEIEDRLKLLLGSGAPVQGVYEAMGEQFKPRDRVDGRIRAGDRILRLKAGNTLEGCTAGFGAWDRVGTKPNGEAKIAPFVMTAAHCGDIGAVFRRAKSNSEGAIFTDTLTKIGHVGRTGFVKGGASFETDAALVKLNAGGLMPRYIYKDVGSLKPVERAGRPWPGEILCYSAPGAEVTKRPCGEFMGVRVRKTPGGKRYVIIARFAGMPGDSGGPVWSPRLQRSVGIILGGPNDGQGRYKGWVTPLLVPRNHEDHAAKVPGVLNAPGLGTFHLATPGS